MLYRIRLASAVLVFAIPFLAACLRAAAQGVGSESAVLNVQPSNVALGTGETQILTVTVTGQSGDAVPTGSVFLVYGGKIQLQSLLDSAGVAFLGVKNLPVGVTSAVVNYTGDSKYGAALAAVTITTVAGTISSATSLTAVPPAISQGMVTELNAVVQGAQTSPVATGTVVYSDGSTTLGSVQIDQNGYASYFAESLGIGTHAIIAAYSGDNNYWPSASAPITVTVAAPAVPPPADFTISLNPAAIAAPETGTISTQVAIKPVNGFSSQVSFVCSGLPASSACSFSPTALTAGAQSTTAAMTITTGTMQMAQRNRGKGRIPGTRLPGSEMAAAALGVFGMMCLRRRRRRWPFLVLALLAGAAGAGSLSACGGSRGSPAGVYAVTVTATSGALTHTATLALQIK